MNPLLKIGNEYEMDQETVISLLELYGFRVDSQINRWKPKPPKFALYLGKVKISPHQHQGHIRRILYVIQKIEADIRKNCNLDS